MILTMEYTGQSMMRMIHRVTGTMQLYIRQSFILQMIPLHCIFRLLRGWCLESKVLKAVRQSIYDNIDEYREIVEDPAFKQYFPVIGENHLKTAPKGFPKDFEYIDYLKCKDYTCAYMVPDAFFLAPDLLDKVEDVFKQLKRFADFTNFTIDDFE